MALDIAAINARADAASEGPWAKNPFTAHVDAFEQGYPIPVCALLWPTDLRTEDQSIADGEFIAHARTDIPTLIAALEASETARVKAEQELDALKDALTNSCDLLESYIDTFGDMSGANRADLNDYRAVLEASESARVKAEAERDADMKRAYIKGRTEWCPAGILDDTERTERDWQSARKALEASK